MGCCRCCKVPAWQHTLLLFCSLLCNATHCVFTPAWQQCRTAPASHMDRTHRKAAHSSSGLSCHSLVNAQRPRQWTGCRIQAPHSSKQLRSHKAPSVHCHGRAFKKAQPGCQPGQQLQQDGHPHAIQSSSSRQSAGAQSQARALGFWLPCRGRGVSETGEQVGGSWGGWVRWGREGPPYTHIGATPLLLIL